MPKEQARLQILNSLIVEHMTVDHAATLMGVSPRHTRRILAAYQEEGATTVAHGHRGRKPANATPEVVATAVVHLAGIIIRRGATWGLKPQDLDRCEERPWENSSASA